MAREQLRYRLGEFGSYRDWSVRGHAGLKPSAYIGSDAPAPRKMQPGHGVVARAMACAAARRLQRV
jgi:hypothetical protein